MNTGHGPRARLRDLLGHAWVAYHRSTPPHRGKQAAARLLDRTLGPFVVRTPAGVWLEAFAASSMDMSYFESRRPWDEPILDVLRSLSPGEAFVDVGANIGFYTLQAARAVGADGRVYAFEPSPREFRRLLLALEMNDAANVIPMSCALGSEPGEANLDVRSTHTGTSAFTSQRGDGIVRVPVLPGDTVLGKYRVDKVLGQGAMGVVLAVTNVDLQKPFAVKIMRAGKAREDQRQR
ncbi:MAG: FkbM family methyltransferase, partial [Myxococcales bacterium]